jgi:glutamate N-acetyltransferase/amino-acid N-acetyltransferase
MAKSELRIIDGGALAAQGFRGAAMHAGIKAKQVPDLVLLASETPCTAAATLTRNRFRAAPVRVTEAHVANGRAQAVIANSGNANCASGKQGLANAKRMTEIAAKALGIAAEDVLVCSTGSIGYQLPMDKIERAAPQLAAELGRDGELLARGIMTTDTRPKMHAVAFEAGGREVRIGGIAKGAGMIEPNMATMLAFVTTDAEVEAGLLRETLRWAVERSFNCISVDACMSTNDTVILLANGASGAKIGAATPEAEVFRAGVLAVCRELAKMIAGDGEGATKLVSIKVSGGRSFEEARTVAKTVANYVLLKVALYGEQFNWGRLVAAIGAAPVAADPEAMTVRMAGVTVWADGAPQEYDKAAAVAALGAKEIALDVELGMGAESAEAWTCDIGEEYIKENVAYEGPAPIEKGG